MPPEVPVPDDVGEPPSLDAPPGSAVVSPTVNRQQLAEEAAVSFGDEPPLAHKADSPHPSLPRGQLDKVRFAEEGVTLRSVQVVGLDALRKGELRGSQAVVDEDVSPCSHVSSGEVSPGSPASPFRNERRLRSIGPHRSPPGPAAAGTSSASFFARFGELRARRPLVVDILRGDAVEGIARRHSAEAAEGPPLGTTTRVHHPAVDSKAATPWVQRLKPGHTEHSTCSVGEAGYAASAMSTPDGEAFINRALQFFVVHFVLLYAVQIAGQVTVLVVDMLDLVDWLRLDEVAHAYLLCADVMVTALLVIELAAQAAVARGCGKYLCRGGRAWGRAFDLATATISIALIVLEIEGLYGDRDLAGEDRNLSGGDRELAADLVGDRNLSGSVVLPVPGLHVDQDQSGVGEQEMGVGAASATRNALRAVRVYVFVSRLFDLLRAPLDHLAVLVDDIKTTDVDLI